MDPVTHGLTGALIAESGFRRRLGGYATLALAGVAMFPDLDIVYRLEGLPSYIANHRALSHSYVGVFAEGLLLGGILGRIDPKRRYVAWISACWVALLSHQMLDVITSYGTVLLYPFNMTRFYLDWVFIIDFFLSGILALFLILARKNPERAEQKARIGLVVAACYVLFCALDHSVALNELKKGAAANGVAFQSAAAIPQPIFPVRWSGILDGGEYYYQVQFWSFQQPDPPYEVYNKNTGSMFEQKARTSELGVLYHWFARYPVVREYVQNDTHVIEFSDLRFKFHVLDFRVRQPFVLRIKMDRNGNILESRLTRS
jgi:inner membrane protein